jgi:hypothetical protein
VKPKSAFQLSFNPSLKVDFQGSRVTSNGGRVGFIVTNLKAPSRAVVRFYNKRGTESSRSRKASRQ